MSRSGQMTGRRSRYDYHYSIPQAEIYDPHYTPLYEPIGSGGSLFGEPVRSGDWDVKVQDWTPIPRPQLLPNVIKNEPMSPAKLPPVAPQRRAFTVLQPVALQPANIENSSHDLQHTIINIDSQPSSYKVQPTVRQHKKSSFSIIAEITPHQSRAASPDLVQSSGRISPFKGRGFKSNNSSQQNSRAASPKSHANLKPAYKILPDVTGVTVPKFAGSENINHDYENLQKIQNNISAIKTVNKAMTQKPPVPNGTRRSSVTPSRQSKIPKRQSLSTDSSPVHKTLRRKASVSPARARTPSTGRVNSRRGVSLSPARQKSIAATTILSKSSSRLNVSSPRGADKSPMRNTISSSYKIVAKSPKATRRNPDLVKREEALKKQQARKDNLDKLINDNAKKSVNVKRRTNSSIKVPTLSPIEGTPTKTEKKLVRNNNSKVLAKVDSRINVRNGSTKGVTSPTRIPKRSTSKSSLTNSDRGSTDDLLKKNNNNNKNDGKLKNNSNVNKTKTSISSKNDNINNNDNDSDKPDNNSNIAQENMAIQTSSDSLDKDASTNTEKLVALTKSNVISMTTAAITAQPVQIATNVTNQIVEKIENAVEDVVDNDNNSQDDLEEQGSDDVEEKPKIFKTETVIELKTKTSSDSLKITHTNAEVKPSSPVKKENTEEVSKETNTVIVTETKQTIEDNVQQNSHDQVLKTESPKNDIKISSVDIVPVIHSVERKLSNKAIAEVKGIVQVEPVERNSVVSDKVKAGILAAAEKELNKTDTQIDSKELVTEHNLKEPPDAEVLSGNLASKDVVSGEPSLAEPSSPEIQKPSLCSRMGCLPCCAGRTNCCKKKAQENFGDQSELDPNSTTALHQTSMSNENLTTQKQSCWKNLACCKNTKKLGSTSSIGTALADGSEILSHSRAALQSSAGLTDDGVRKQSCFDKILCCKRANKISSFDSTNESLKTTGCCGRCRKNKQESEAWSNRGSSLLSAPPTRCCGVLCLPFARCCKCCSCCKKPVDESVRRSSLFSKKQSIAPTLPPEDTRPKLDVSLIEHNSLMKGAIPILPTKLAWFCLICNVICPGLGTIFSGLFCLCFGIPRFGVHEGPRQRIGSFVINILVGIAQLFTVLFCLVGWGWAIWWGVIMLKTSRKHKKLKAEAEKLDGDEPISNLEQNHRDVEQGR